MKNIIIGILLVATLALGSLYVLQGRKTDEAQATIASLRQEAGEMEGRLDKQEKRAANLQSRLHETRAEAAVEVAAKAGAVAQLEQALTNRIQTNAKPANPFAEMFKSPEMKELVQTQQKAVLSGMIDKNYASFFAALALSPEQSASLKDLIVKKSLVDAGLGVSFMAGDMDAAKRTELIQQAKADKDAINAQIQQFLGDDNYPQFQAYEKTQPERMSINMFKDQQATGAGALNPDQESHLIQAMTEERQNFKFATDFYDQSKFDGDFAAHFTDEKLNQFQQEREQLDQQYLARARSILSPDQLGPFEKFLVSQRQMQFTGMRMAQKMFAPKEGGN